MKFVQKIGPQCDVAMERQDLASMIDQLGQRYSKLLDIDLESGEDEEIFKWFLAAILFGAPITETSAIKTYRCFHRHGVITPEKILQAGWNRLVEILDEGSYTRYDYKTADKLLEVMKRLQTMYGGSLNILHEKATDSKDLEGLLKGLGKGIGDVTVGIFLRELRELWSKANPNPTPLVICAARELGIVAEEDSPERALEKLKDFWRQNRIAGKSFIHFETALLRFGKSLRRKRRV